MSRLVAALNDAAHQTEAATIIRDLVARIVLTPNAERTELTIDLYGDLAGILSVANDHGPRTAAKSAKARSDLSPEAVDSLVGYVQGKLVAGARDPLTLLFNDYDVKPIRYRATSKSSPEPRP